VDPAGASIEFGFCRLTVVTFLVLVAADIIVAMAHVARGGAMSTFRIEVVAPLNAVDTLSA